MEQRDRRVHWEMGGKGRKKTAHLDVRSILVPEVGMARFLTSKWRIALGRSITICSRRGTRFGTATSELLALLPLLGGGQLLQHATQEGNADGFYSRPMHPWPTPGGLA